MTPICAIKLPVALTEFKRFVCKFFCARAALSLVLDIDVWNCESWRCRFLSSANAWAVSKLTPMLALISLIHEHLFTLFFKDLLDQKHQGLYQMLLQ